MRARTGIQQGKGLQVKLKLWKKAFYFLPALLFLMITGLDLLLFFVGFMPEVVRILRDFFLLSVILLLIPLQQLFPIFKEKKITLILRNIILLSVIAWAVFTVSTGHYHTLVATGSIFTKLSAFARNFLIGTLSAVLVLLLNLSIFALLKNLVLYKSKPTTLRNFRLLLIAILIFAVISSWSGVETFRFGTPFTATPFGLSYGAVLLLIFVNATRTAWISFLNRGQKWRTFLLTPVVIFCSTSVMYGIRDSFIVEYSVVWAALIASFSAFLFAYSLFSGILLLLHLPTARIYDEKMIAIRSLQELSQSISLFLERSELMQKVTQLAAQVIHSDFAWLEMYDARHDRFTLGAAVHLSEEEKSGLPLDTGDGISRWVLRNHDSVVANDAGSDARTVALREWKKDIGAVLAVGVRSNDRFFGVLFSANTSMYSFDQFDRDMLQSFADQAAIAFQNAHLLAESLEKERLTQELRIAREAQQKLLPRTMPRIPGVDVAGFSIPAQEVGGDYFDLKMSDDKLVVIIGDVSGKGTAAAFYMAEVKGIIDCLVDMHDSPAELLARANRVLYRGLEKNMFVTLLCAYIDPVERSVTFSRAGHSPMIWYPKGQAPRLMDSKGIALGLDSGRIFEQNTEEKCLRAGAGDFLVFYTDGLTEARNPQQQEFQEKKLLSILANRTFITAGELQEHIIAAVKEHMHIAPMHDDFTLVVVKFGE